MSLKKTITEKAAARTDSDIPRTAIRFENRETPHFRYIHVDGAFGGQTPSGDIITFFFNQHIATASASVHEWDVTTGRVGDEISAPHSNAIQRNTEVAVIMSLTTANAFREWLGKTLDAAQRRGEPK